MSSLCSRCTSHLSQPRSSAGGLLPDQADALHPIELAEKQAEGALADFNGSEIAGPEKVVDGSLVRAPVWAFAQFVLRQSPSSPRSPAQHRGGLANLTSRGQRASPEKFGRDLSYAAVNASSCAEVDRRSRQWHHSNTKC